MVFDHRIPQIVNRMVSLKSLALLGDSRLRAVLWLQRDAHAFYRLQFLDAAAGCGLLDALRTPTTAVDLTQRLHVARTDLLQSLLDLGVALGEVAVERGRYRLRGRRARALGGEAGDALAALVHEWVAYHSAVFRWLPAGLQGTSLVDYLRVLGGVIARSSRVLEPLVGSFAERAVAAVRAGRRSRDGGPSGGAVRLLEIGCGSGVYLRRAAAADPEVTGVGIDLDSSVAAQARANLAAWRIAQRFAILVADARHLPGSFGGPFDLITLYNNIYYFDTAERLPLLASLRRQLAPGGSLALVSLMRNRNVDGAAFDLVLRSTPGCAPLPDLGELCEQLTGAGFTNVKTVPLAPGVPLYGLLAST
ncbi:MAG: class I SAM-dependent methyltransferase [Chloroflexi bacterium]|nr:class I SAM-dependent methyltransferase [Chloroflexota bacterium]